MKNLYIFHFFLFFCLSILHTQAQNCGTVYGAGYNGSGSSIGIQSYDFTTNTFNGTSLVNTALFTAPNTMNSGGPIAIDPLNQEINFVTDATSPRRTALFTFGAASLNIVNFPSVLDALITEQVFCSGYKELSHECYYMTGSFLSTYPTPAGSGFFSIDFTNPASPTYKFYTSTLSPGSPLVNISGGGNLGADLCLDHNGVGYLVTGSKQLFKIAIDETNSTAVFTYLADMSALTFTPTAVAFNPSNDHLVITGATQTVAEYNLTNNVITNLTTTAGYAAPDLASCFFPVLNPNILITKSFYDVTQNKYPPLVAVHTNDIIEFTVTVTNNGNVNAGGLTILDPIPAGTVYVANSTFSNGLAVADGAGSTFPFSTKNPSNSSDQNPANGVLSTNATAGAPKCIIKYSVQVTASSGAVLNVVQASIAGSSSTTPVTVTAYAGFVLNETLPLKFIDFSASIVANGVQLNWTTSNEVNLNRFEMETSTDGITYRQLGKVNADRTQISTVHKYSFTDMHPVAGEHFYRLKQIDNDNQFAYSSVQKVILKNTNAQIVSIYPNPVNSPFINLAIGQNFQTLNVKITNTIGQIVSEKKFQHSENLVKLDITQLAKGCYFVSIIADNKQVQVTKLIIE